MKNFARIKWFTLSAALVFVLAGGMAAGAQSGGAEPGDINRPGNTLVAQNVIENVINALRSGITEVGKAAPPVEFTVTGANGIVPPALDKNLKTSSVKDYGAAGDGFRDDSDAIQSAMTALKDGQKLIFPPGKYRVTKYLKIIGKNNIELYMEGTVVPTGALNNVNAGLFTVEGCRNVKIRPNIVNPEYTSTINAIRLNSDSHVQIVNGTIDIKYNTKDGTAGIQVGANTRSLLIQGNYIRSGYGILVNDAAGVADISIVDNEIVGQKAYGSTGTGDAIEINSPNKTISNIIVARNRIHDYVADTRRATERIIAVGFAHVSNFTVEDNTIWDSEMEAIHIEDGSTKFMIRGNQISSGISGITVSSRRETSDFIISDNRITLPAAPPGFPIDYGAGIVLNTNQVNANKIKRFSVTGNVLTGSKGAHRGFAAYSVEDGVISNNTISGFPRHGFWLEKFPGSATTEPTNLTITDNIVRDCGWNYVIGGLTSGKSVAKAGPLKNVLFDRNQSIGSQFGLDYNIEVSKMNGSVIRVPKGNTRRKLSPEVETY